MKKVFLVDDEIVIREGIRDRIAWNEEGFEYCGDAPDGELALPLIEETKPDIVITDIKMPFMDGLELSRIIRERFPSIKIIILSGHDEFEYAREALRTGVTEYCLKPVSSADLIKLLQDVSALIDREEREREEMERLKRRVSDGVRHSREKLLSDLCSGLVTTSEAMQTAAKLQLNLVSKCYAVVLSEQECPANVPEAEEVCRRLEELMHGRFGETASYLSFKRSKKETVWILQGDSAAQLQDLGEKLLKPLAEEAHTALSSRVRFGLGSIQDRLQGLYPSFQEAEESLKRQLLPGSPQGPGGDWQGGGEAGGPLRYLDRSPLIRFLKLGSPAAVPSFVREYAACLSEWDGSRSFYYYYLLHDMTATVSQLAKESYPEHERIEDMLQALQSQVGLIQRADEAYRYLEGMIGAFLQVRDGNADKYSGLIRRVKDYMHANYGQSELSLQHIAEHVRMSPSYISSVFSSETGQTITEYLTGLRIGKAMELLRSTHAKSYEIAYQVGYQDSHYFSNLFKKSTGMTTREFRRNQAQSGHPDEGEERHAALS
ncbi:response regulator [Paenibacillus mucilaginosus]|uniref:YesN11 n=1 Tax=Paenibacillus mucilaginosus (strain KNP414) TaxID=1036673 RepID=F8F8R8_PAEMK|nr:response regulator [Paenibacillus mucilaginosus]AEI41980.1 YesN11 [Paenibacillus mucilaginosus KNP414]MCG7217836.1 response regulator [Paenibacillus mucilaginosus]WDM28884.1 response regulator [Paenibacillus mucilaginosus]